MEAKASETPKQDGGRREIGSLDSIRTVVSEVMTTGMAALQAELKKDLSDFRTCFREDIKKQMDEFVSEVNRRIQDVTGQIEGAVERVGQMEENMLDVERWDIGVKDTLTQLLTNQRALQEKVTDLEGRSRRNNIRIYGIPEDAEGTSAVTFIENFIKTELGSELGHGLGIECTRNHHRVPRHAPWWFVSSSSLSKKRSFTPPGKRSSVSKTNGCILIMIMQRRCRIKGRNICPSRKYYGIMAYISRPH